MAKAKEIPKERYREWYRKLMTVRRFEEKVDELFRAGKIAGAVHTSVGQEAVAVGFGEAMEKKDVIIATHRGHGHCIMRGADLKAMMAELFGKATGLCKGKGGSMHIVDAKNGMLGAMGIVGEGMPIAAGVGLAIKMQKTGQVCICFFGDNASNGGPFHEAHNVASLWKLPVVFVCENNLYGLTVSAKKSTSVVDIADRAKGYAMPGAVVDGMDVTAVFETAKEAIERARKGEGPSLIEAKTYRFLGHSRGDPPWGPYRTKEEVDSWKKRDPRLILIKTGSLTPEETERIDQEVEAVIAEAIRFAEESPQPEIKVALEHVYV